MFQLLESILFTITAIDLLPKNIPRQKINEVIKCKQSKTRKLTKTLQKGKYWQLIIRNVATKFGFAEGGWQVKFENILLTFPQNRCPHPPPPSPYYPSNLYSMFI